MTAALPLQAATLPYTALLDLAERGAVALVPVGSTEAHGPHLPLGVDTIIAGEVCRRVWHLLEAQGIDCVIFPPLSYGVTDFAGGFSGTISVAAEATLAYLQGVLTDIARHRFTRIGVINHHLEPAHFAVVHEAAKGAAAASGSRVVVPDHRKKPIGPRLGEEFIHGGSHAGLYETSLMLAAAPTLVREDIRQRLPELAIDLPARIKAGARSFEELGGTQAYLGAPAQASAAEGERLFGILAEVSAAAVLAGG